MTIEVGQAGIIDIVVGIAVAGTGGFPPHAVGPQTDPGLRQKHAVIILDVHGHGPAAARSAIELDLLDDRRAAVVKIVEAQGRHGPAVDGPGAVVAVIAGGAAAAADAAAVDLGIISGVLLQA